MAAKLAADRSESKLFLGVVTKIGPKLSQNGRSSDGKKRTGVREFAPEKSP